MVQRLWECNELGFGGFIAGKAVGHGPEASRIECLERHRMGHEPGAAAVAVQERVNPQQAVMRGDGGENDVGFGFKL